MRASIRLIWLRTGKFLQSVVKAVIKIRVGRDSSVGIATDNGMDGPGIESRSGRDFPHLSRPALGPIQPPVQWIPGLSWGKVWSGRDADPYIPASAVVRKWQSYTSTPPMGRTACTEPQCLYKGDLYLNFPVKCDTFF